MKTSILLFGAVLSENVEYLTKQLACSYSGLTASEAETKFRREASFEASTGNFPSGEQILETAEEMCGCPEDQPGCHANAVNPIITMAISGGYGCWCTLGSTTHGVLSGKGKPKDIMDGYCRELTESYKCIIEEYMEETGQLCEPWNEPYTPQLISMSSERDVSQVQHECAQLESPNSCKVKACTVEVLFVYRYFTFYMMNSAFSAIIPLKHAEGFLQGSFELNDANCPVVRNPGVVHKYCCGEYPYRYRKYSSVATTECCGDDEYDTQVDQCCNDEFKYGWDAVLKTVGAAC